MDLNPYQATHPFLKLKPFQAIRKLRFVQSRVVSGDVASRFCFAAVLSRGDYHHPHSLLFWPTKFINSLSSRKK